MDICPTCNGPIRVGDFPFCGGDPAKHVSVKDEQFHRPFKPYYDLGLDRDVNSYGEAKRIEKEQGVYQRRPRRGNILEV